MTITFPDKLQCLFAPKRYKILYGGRGGAKSWGIARALLIQGAAKPLRILCAREFQNSISDSVHKLLSDQIHELGLEGFYEILQTSIRGQNGTEFAFTGLRHNATKLKSFEGVDVCWVEEAQTVSKASWNTLIPTIRKEGSEIWVSFNPELEDDETYQRFVLHPPAEAAVVKIDWRDNPWFPDVLRKEMEALKERDPDAYLNVWEGQCRKTLEGAIYAKEIRKAYEENRVTKVLPFPGKPIETFWDLGKRDHTAIWFAQIQLGEYRILDFYQNRAENLPHYFDVMREKGYQYGTIWLPHDAEQDRLTGTIAKVVREAFPNNSVRIVPRMNKKSTGIEAVRRIFPNCYFDAEKTKDGLTCLSRFKYEVDPDTGNYSTHPLHDEYSDGADAFAQLALSLQEPRKRTSTITAAAPSFWAQ